MVFIFFIALSYSWYQKILTTHNEAFLTLHGACDVHRAGQFFIDDAVRMKGFEVAAHQNEISWRVQTGNITWKIKDGSLIRIAQLQGQGTSRSVLLQGISSGRFVVQSRHIALTFEYAAQSQNFSAYIPLS